MPKLEDMKIDEDSKLEYEDLKIKEGWTTNWLYESMQRADYW